MAGEQDMFNPDRFYSEPGDETLNQALGKRLFVDIANYFDAQKSFSKIDTNANGTLELGELAKARDANDPVATRLISDFTELKRASDDEWRKDDSGITHNDLKASLKKSLEDETGREDFDRAKDGVSITYRTNPDLSLHSLEIEDKNRDVKLAYRGGSLSVSRGKQQEAHKEPLSQDDKENEIIDQDLARGASFGKDLILAYQMALDGKEAFSKVDDDGNGFLTKKELNKFIGEADTAATLTDRRLARASRSILANYGKLKGASLDEWGLVNYGITTKDLSANLINVAAKNDVESRIQRQLAYGAKGLYSEGSGMATLIDFSAGVKVEKSHDTKMLEVTDRARGQVVQLYGEGKIRYSEP